MGEQTWTAHAATRTQAALYAAAARATAAPSIHNTQPWLFEVTERALDLRRDPARRLAVLDPDGRQQTISCGAALVTARLSLQAAGMRVAVRLLPKADDADLLARVEVLSSQEEPDAAAAALDAVVDRRHTNRRAFVDEPVPTGLIDALRGAAEREGAWLKEIRSDEERLLSAIVLQAADTAERTDEAYLAELRQWTTGGSARADGVPTWSVPQADAAAPQDIPVRDFDTSGGAGLPSLPRAGRRQCLLVLVTERDDVEAWLQAGQALQRMLLEVTLAGFVASPFSQPTEVPRARARLQRELQLLGRPQLMLRVGRAAPTGATPRRPLDDVVRVGTGQDVDGVVRS